MTTRSVALRLNRLVRVVPRHIPEGECPHPHIGFLAATDDPPPRPEDIAWCPVCGGRHILTIDEVVVAAGGEAAPCPRPC